MKLLEKLEPLFVKFPALRKGADRILLLKKIWNHPRGSFMPRLYIVSMIILVIVYPIAVRTVWQILHPHVEVVAHHKAAHGAEEHAPAGGEGHGEAAGGHGESKEGADLIGETSPFPESVEERQDGEMEVGHDLLDKEAIQDRSIASLFKSDDTVRSRPHRYVDLDDIISSSSRNSDEPEVTVLVGMVLEVNSPEGEKELKDKKSEVGALVLAMLAEQTPNRLKDIRKMGKFKADVQREINHMLVGGKITDVLFTKYNIK